MASLGGWRRKATGVRRIVLAWLHLLLRLLLHLWLVVVVLLRCCLALHEVVALRHHLLCASVFRLPRRRLLRAAAIGGEGARRHRALAITRGGGGYGAAAAVAALAQCWALVELLRARRQAAATWAHVKLQRGMLPASVEVLLRHGWREARRVWYHVAESHVVRDWRPAASGWDVLGRLAGKL